ncbi:MAG: hypothetical protein JXB60_09050, partial [Candidatus Cloacimonetes bacterium]|nr:hypothetical protein [Candidatus Cloacimonadota bacterium]
DPFHDYQVLKKELHLYDPYLDRKEHLIALSKTDTIPEEVKTRIIKEVQVKFRNRMQEDIIAISSVTGENISGLKTTLFRLIKKIDRTQ